MILSRGHVCVELAIIVPAVPGDLKAVALFPLGQLGCAGVAAFVCPDGTHILATASVRKEVYSHEGVMPSYTPGMRDMHKNPQTASFSHSSPRCSFAWN